MMDRNREARRAAAMANGLPRRRQRTTGGTLRDSPEGDGPLELQDMAARLRDRTAKKDRDREMRERDRDRDRLNRSKRRRGDKYMHGREEGGDDSSEESVNDEDEEDDEGPVRYVPPSNPMSPSSVASALTSHRKSYPPSFKVFRVAPSGKAPDEMIGVSVPRKARSVSTKRGHGCWSSSGGGGSGELVHRQASSSPVRSTMTAAAAAVGTVPSPLPAPPASPSSSNVSIKKKIANGLKQRPPKSTSKSSPSIQDEIEIEVAEVLYGLMRQSQGPSKQEGLSNDSAQLDCKSRVSSTIPDSSSVPAIQPSSSFLHNNSSSSASPLTTVAPKRKRPRPYPDEIPGTLGPRSSPVSLIPTAEVDQAPKLENGDFRNSHDPPPAAPSFMSNSGILSDAKQPLVEESTGGRNGMLIAKAEEASSSPQNHDRVESSATSTKTNSAPAGNENHIEKFEIDLMAPPPQSRTSPEREEKAVECGREGNDEKSMVKDREAEAKPSTEPNEEDEKEVKSGSGVELNGAAAAEEAKAKSEPPKQQQEQQQQHLDGKERDRNIDPQLDLEKSSVNDSKLNLQKQLTPPPKTTRDDANTDKPGDQSGSVPLPISVAGGWHGGLPPMGYVGPLQGVVSMDGTTVASPPIQPPHFLFSHPRSKRCATHCYIARSISIHQQMMKVNPFWPAAAAAAAAAAGTAPLFGAKPYNLNMVPSADLHAGGRGVVDSAQDNRTQPFALFPGQPASSSKDKSPLIPNVTEAAQRKQFLLPPAVPPGATAGNILHAPTLFFPMGQQQAAANGRPSSTKSPSTAGSAASTNTSTSASMGAGASTVGPTMSFSYPNMGGNETQFMAILGNGPYPFPIPTHVGAAAPPYRGSHPQAMPFFNGSFYSSQVLHLPQQQQNQQQIQQNACISTTSSSSQKHLQGQQQRPYGSGATTAGNPSPALQNFQGTKGRPTQTQHDMGSEDSPSTAESRTRPNLSVYGQSFAMPFQSGNFALMTPPSSLGASGNNATGGANGNHGDKKQLQQSHHASAFPMSFATINGATTPGLDVSSMAHNYQMMAAAAAAQAAQQKKNNYRGAEDGKTGAGTDTSIVDEERKALAARTSAASVGQSIAFSRDLAETSISSMPGNTVVDSSARSLNLMPGSARMNHSSRPNSGTNSKASNSQPQQQQQQQLLFPKQQQFVASSAAPARGKTPSTSNGNVYPDVTSSSAMAAKFPNALSGFPPLVQTSSTPTRSLQWKSSVGPNTSQVSSPSVAISTAPNSKTLSQQQGRPQQNHTQISFGASSANPKPSTTLQGQQTQTSNLAPSSPMMVGSPSTSSISKSAGGSAMATANASTGNKAGAQASTLSSQQGKNSPSQSLSSQKASILGSPHMMSTSSSASKLQMQHSQQQPQLSKQSIQQAQLFSSNAYMQASANTPAAMAGSGYYLQRPKPENQQQQQGPKPQGLGSTTSSSGMSSLCAPVSLASTSTSDPAKALAAAAAAASSMKGGLPSQGIFHAAQFAAQSAGGAHQLMPAGFPYVHAVSAAVQVKPADEQKQPAA